MTARYFAVACALFAAAADAASAQTTFAYRYDQPARFRFLVADTVESNMDTPMGPMSSSIGATGKYTLELTPRQDSTHVKLEISDYAGTMQAMGQTMPMPTQTTPPIEMMLSRTGAARVIAAAAAGGALSQVPGMGSMTARMFVRLPAGPVAMGATWTDSVTENVDSAGMRLTVKGTSTSTYAADTTVGGRRLHRLHVVTNLVITGGGNAGGMDMTQDMTSVSTADWLWDPQRRIFTEMAGETATTGVMTMSGMGSMNVKAKMKSRLKLAED